MKETKQKKSGEAFAIHIMLLIMVISLIIRAVAAENEEKYSILVIAHESWGKSWCAPRTGCGC